MEKNEDNGYDNYMSFLNQIEKLKIWINAKTIDDIKRINCLKFHDFIEEDFSELICKNILTYPEKWKINKNNEVKIQFPYQIMIDFTKEIIFDNTEIYIWEIIDLVKAINSIIYAGTVFSNSYSISMIQNQLSNKNNSCVTNYPALAVVRGANMYGMNPFVIKSRITKFNIGIRISENWDKSKHFKRQDLNIKLL